MERKDNYLLQVQQAKQHFLKYDQQKLVNKLRIPADETYLYPRMLGSDYRIHRQTGDLERLADTWVDANTHAEYMTLMDLVCDSQANRRASGNWKTMVSFGHMFHRDLLEGKDAFAEAIQGDMDIFCRACESLGGKVQPIGDISYAFTVFEDLQVCLQFWEADEDFFAQVVWFWDENALQYLKYETMYYAVGLLKKKLWDKMKTLTA